MYRLAIALSLVVAAASGAAAMDVPGLGPGLPNVKLGPLPVPSYWISNRGSQLKLYNYVGQTVADTPTGFTYGKFSGVINSTSAPDGCQYQTFELLPGAAYAEPEVAFGVTWKNLSADCHAQTVWDGILNGDKLQLERMDSRRTASGKVIRSKRVVIEIFQKQP
jgi:hypothetical protein